MHLFSIQLKTIFTGSRLVSTSTRCCTVRLAFEPTIAPFFETKKRFVIVTNDEVNLVSVIPVLHTSDEK